MCTFAAPLPKCFANARCSSLVRVSRRPTFRSCSARCWNECLAVSAGGSGKAFHFSAGIRRTIKRWGVGTTEIPSRVSEYLGEYPKRNVFAVRARTASDERSLSHIYDASMGLFGHVAKRYRCIRMQLLAAGGTDKLGAAPASWKVRTYPERFSFIQIVRAWAAWRIQPRRYIRLGLCLEAHCTSDAPFTRFSGTRREVCQRLKSDLEPISVDQTRPTVSRAVRISCKTRFINSSTEVSRVFRSKVISPFCKRLTRSQTSNTCA